MDTTFLSPKRIQIIRIEQRDTHVGPVEHGGNVVSRRNTEAYNQLIMHDGLNTIVSTAKEPSTWKNSFGDMWRANIKRHGNHYNKDNAPWRFAIDANQSDSFIHDVESLITNPVPDTDFVIATYTCPAHTWFRDKNGQVAFLYDQAIRHTHVIDRTNIHHYLENTLAKKSMAASLLNKFLPAKLKLAA